jgi:hypothetical protein
MKNYFKRLSISLSSLALVALAPILSAVSCQHPQNPQWPVPEKPVTYVFSEISFGDMILSTSNPTNEFIGAELVTIAENSATLRILKTGEYVSAKTNTYFSGRSFGTQGLLLRWVSKEKGQIGVERFGSETEIR